MHSNNLRRRLYLSFPVKCLYLRVGRDLVFTCCANTADTFAASVNFAEIDSEIHNTKEYNL